MRKFLFTIIMVFICATTIFAQRTTRSKTTAKKNTSTTVTLKTPTDSECKSHIDYCFNRYCFDKKTIEKGRYSLCGSIPASTIQLNAEECLDTRAIIYELDLNKGCRSLTYNYIIQLLANKDNIEKGMKRNSKDCSQAILALDAAKQCHAMMIAHDGSNDPTLYSGLASICDLGKSGDALMVERFYNAGNYGESNIGAIRDMQITNQNTVKRENWRQIVDGTLAGYIEMAELSCGDEDYQITQINKYSLDDRNNLEMIKQKAKADEIGRDTARRIVGGWFQKQDCTAQALPKGGERWTYDEKLSPPCRLVCKINFKQGDTSNECVSDIPDATAGFNANYIGFNWNANSTNDKPLASLDIDNSTSASNSTYNAPSPVTATSNTTPTPKPSSAQGTLKGSNATCSISEMCKMFVNENGNGFYFDDIDKNNILMTGFGNSTGNYTRWVNKADLLSSAQTQFGKSFIGKMNDLANNLKQTCGAQTNNYRNYTGEIKCSSTIDTSVDALSGAAPSIRTTICNTNIDLSPNTMNLWLSFIKNHTGPCPTHIYHIEGLIAHKNKTKKNPIYDNAAYGNSAFIQAQAFKSCICAESN